MMMKYYLIIKSIQKHHKFIANWWHNGIGCHYGNTDIFFGDPINNALQLGEDIVKIDGYC